MHVATTYSIGHIWTHEEYMFYIPGAVRDVTSVPTVRVFKWSSSAVLVSIFCVCDLGGFDIVVVRDVNSGVAQLVNVSHAYTLMNLSLASGIVKTASPQKDGT